MVRISIPTLPASLASLPKSPLSHVTVKEAAAYLARFLDEGKGKTVILSGAGVSVDSGIRAYRGKEGHYANPNYKWVSSLLICPHLAQVLVQGIVVRRG